MEKKSPTEKVVEFVRKISLMEKRLILRGVSMSVKMIEQIKGHDKIKEQIKQALIKDRLPHALLFSGPSGVGKRQMAWALAQSLFV